MNPYQILGIIAGSASVLLGIIAVLVMQGVSVIIAFFVVYLVAVLVMIGMQKCAGKLHDDLATCEQQGCYRETTEREVRVSNLREIEPDSAIEMHA